jgi:hypothetical protein
LKSSFEPEQDVAFPRGLFQKGGVAELQVRLVTRFVRGHTGGDILVDALLYVKPKLVIDVGIEAARAQGGPKAL